MKITRRTAAASALAACMLTTLGLAASAGPATAGTPAKVANPGHPAIHVALKSQARGLAGEPIVESENWAGFVALPTSKHGTFPRATVTFNIPAINCNKTPGSGEFGSDDSQWVGLDGWTDSTVEQNGVTGVCNGTTPSYYAWFEMYPQATIVSALQVAPGDAFRATVSFAASGVYTLTDTDITQGLQQTETSRCPAGSTCRNTSAEVISEAPFGNAILPLADFGMINWGNVLITDKSGGAGGFTDTGWTFEQIDQTNVADTKVLDAPGPLFGGRAFDDQWFGEQ